jgi:hypothetical protein
MLELKEDAMVMCTKNNFEAGYVNGTLGRVVRFDEGYPVIETTEGKEILMKTTTWELAEDGKVLAQIEQLPLRLAWAITIHKSQGMSLDAAEIDLSKAFVYGQGYVALSRVRSLDGLKILGMHANALQVDPKVVQRDAKFHTESEAAEDAFIEMEDKEVAEMHERFVVANGGRVPGDDEVGVVRVGAKSVSAESTYAVTKELLLEGRSITDMAKVRSVTDTTIWTHLEKLVHDKQITLEHITHLEPADIDWEEARKIMDEAMKEFGTEKLKPIYEEAGEEYDYTQVRLARMQYTLSQAEDIF